MRPTGRLHLGHYHGVLKNWVRLQEQYDCYFFVADWHALTTHYDDPSIIAPSVFDMVVDWLAAGVDPERATLFIQSHVPEHAELHLLLSMITPLGWLERVPSFKDQQEKLKDRDLATYGFLGYPLLQSADILAYQAGSVPVGEDQVAHVELTREIARRFNHLYGREPGYEERAEAALAKLGKKATRQFRAARKRYQEQGDAEALAEARALVAAGGGVSADDHRRLLGFLESGGRAILSEPRALLTPASKMPGLDGRKMSKSYGNVIELREEPELLRRKLQTMPTDPARVRRTDPGDPDKCPVWQLHEIFSGAETRAWVQDGCRKASFGCLDCKEPLIETLLAEQRPFRERAAAYQAQPKRVRSIIAEGCARARAVARKTLGEVREAMGLVYE